MYIGTLGLLSREDVRKMKSFDFEISPISMNLSREGVSSIVSLIKLYRMNEFLRYCMRRSLYSDVVRGLCGV